MPEVDRGILTIPNAITLIRLLLIVPVLVELDRSLTQPQYALAWLLAYCGVILLDLVDGYVARHFNQGSHIGKLIDPLVDKLVMFTSFVWIIFALDPQIGPWWLAAAGTVYTIRLTEDALSTAWYLEAWTKHQAKQGANWFGKAKVWCDTAGFVAAYIWLVRTDRANGSAMILVAGSGTAAVMAGISLRQKYRQRRQR